MMINRKDAVQALADTNAACIKCNGNSMRPIMEPGDALHLQKVDNSKLRKGDAVLCRIKGSLQVHKISAINGDRYQISNSKNFVNGWFGSSAIFGLCVRVNDRVLVSNEELQKR